MSFRKTFGIILSSIGFIFGLCGCDKGGSSLEVTFLNAGKADAIIIEQGGHAMVIDAGEQDDGDKVVSHLKDRGIKKIDALIISHFDKDHVGGADIVTYAVTVDKVFAPAYEGVGKQYLQFLEALSKCGIKPDEVTGDIEFEFADCSVLIEPPASYEIPEGYDEYDNNLSLIVSVRYKDDRFLFTGDAESVRIDEWLGSTKDPSCTLIKMPHHGRYDPKLPILLEKSAPKIAVMCDSEKNPADEETVKLLDGLGITYYETKHEDITAISENGNGITIR